jgi:hypothetical protein
MEQWWFLISVRLRSTVPLRALSATCMEVAAVLLTHNH